MDTLTRRERYLIDQAVKSTLSEMGITKPDEMSQIQAYKKYGEGIVKRWVSQGKINFKRKGTSINSKKVVLTVDIERVYDSEKQIVVNFKKK